MNVRRVLAVFAFAMLCVPISSRGQDFGVLESAETINRGNFKLLGTPLVVFGENGADDQAVIALGAGYGVAPSFDIEGKVAFGDATIFGANVEYWLNRHEPLDLSIIAGVHRHDLDGSIDIFGVDLTLLGSKHATSRLEVYGALDLAFNRYTKAVPFDRSYTQAHIVPGIEFAISDELDVVAEFGVGVTDRSRNYFGAGLAFYVR